MDPETRLWQLSPYEIDREPQSIPEDSRVVTTTGRLLESELQCAICLDILRNTHTTKECLHRFCNECISQALRNGNKECPNCRKKLVSMRSLRPDPLFDDIIKTIFPSRREMEQHQAALLAKLSKSTNARGGKGPGRRGAQESLEEPLAGPSSEADQEEGARGEEGAYAYIELAPCHEKIQGLRNKTLVVKWKRRQIRVKPDCSVGHVCRFVLTRLLVEREQAATVNVEAAEVNKVHMHIRIKHGDFRLLDHQQTLTQVHDMYWNIKRPMRLCFSFSGNIHLK